MERSTIKLEIPESLVTDEIIHDLAGTDLTISAPCYPETNPEQVIELKQEGSMNNSVELLKNDEMQNENLENHMIEPSLKMISNKVVIASQDDNFNNYELFKTVRRPYCSDQQEDVNQDLTIPPPNQEMVDVIIKQEKPDDVLMNEIDDKEVLVEIQNCGEHIKLEIDINCSWVDNLKETSQMEAQPVMENEMFGERPQEDLVKFDRMDGDTLDDQTANFTFSERVRQRRFQPRTATAAFSDKGSDYNEACLEEKLNPCDESFMTQQHQGVHNEEKPYVCAACDKCFKTMQYLQQHHITHTKEKPHACTTCDKSFKTRQHLIQHQNTHTGEKPYDCTRCDKSFKTQQHLQQHQVTHTGGKPYTCTTCDKSFKMMQHLQQHQITHTGKKPYGCTRCDRSFKTLQHLQQHQRTHTVKKSYGCTKCDKIFTTRQALQRHQRKHTMRKH